MSGEFARGAGTTAVGVHLDGQPDLDRKCQEMIQSVVNSFVSGALREAAASGGSLTEAQIEGLRAGFLAQAENLTAPCDHFVSGLLRVNGAGRSRPFHRLIVSRFEHMLAGRGRSEHPRSDELPRRFLPGFFVAIDKMLGADRIAEYERRCARIIERLKAERGADFSWADVYTDREANTLVIDPMVEIALLFDNLERRASWFIELVNNHLGDDSDRVARHGPGEWRLSDWTLQRVLRSMFSDLDAAFRDEALRAYICDRFGTDGCAVVENVLARIRDVSSDEENVVPSQASAGMGR